MSVCCCCGIQVEHACSCVKTGTTRSLQPTSSRHSKNLLGGCVAAGVDDQLCSCSRAAAFCVQAHACSVGWCQASIAVYCPLLVGASRAAVQGHRGASCGGSGIDIQAERSSRRRGVHRLNSVAVAAVAGLELLAQASTAGAEHQLLTICKPCIANFHTQGSNLQQAGAGGQLTCRWGSA